MAVRRLEFAALAAPLALVLPATAALAQEASAEEQAGADTPWSLSLSGGVSLPDHGKGETNQQVSLTRGIGAGYVSLSGMRSVSDGNNRFRTLGSKAERVTLGGGIAFGQVSVDAYASLGRRKYKPILLPARRLSVSGTADEWSLGGSVTWSMPVGESLSVAPYASVDTGRTETVRVINGFAGPVTLREKQKGTSGSAGVNLSRSFGPEGAHALGANLAWSTSSNASASTASGVGARRLRRVRALGQGSTGSDSWFEYGVSASFQLGATVALDLSADRTAGVIGPESTSLGGGLRFAF